jgi:hypothetical protein
MDNLDEAFIDECRFAKLVETPNGTGILIGGMVFRLEGPPSIGTNLRPDYTASIVSALRRGAAFTGLSEGTVSATVGNG